MIRDNVDSIFLVQCVAIEQETDALLLRTDSVVPIKTEIYPKNDGLRVMFQLAWCLIIVSSLFDQN
jgi:hypothetical protein